MACGNLCQQLMVIFEAMLEFDVVGVGLNATDTLILLPKFPAYAGKSVL